MNSQIPIAGFSLLLVIALLFNNKKLKKYALITIILTSIYFLMTTMILSSNAEGILLIYFDFFVKSLSAFMIASVPVDGKSLYRAFLNVALLNFLSIATFPFNSFLDSMNYMRFGYAMIPSVLMFIFAIFDTKFRNFFWISLTGLSLALTIFYGSRGPLLVLLIFFMLLFASSRISKLKKIVITSVLGLLVAILRSNDLVIRIIDYIYFDLGIETYALAKIRMMLLSGILESSSGREVIYGQIINAIRQNVFLGHGIGFTTINYDITAHNIVLQILVESGLIGLIIWLTIWIYGFIQYRKMYFMSEKGLFRITTVLIAVSFGRLLISSDMWLRPEYWFLLSFLAGFKYNKKESATL